MTLSKYIPTMFDGEDLRTVYRQPLYNPYRKGPLFRQMKPWEPTRVPMSTLC